MTTPSNPPGPFAITLGALSSGFHASTDRPPNSTITNRLPTGSSAMPFGRPRMQHVADVVELDAGIGDVEGARLRDRDVVQKYGAQRRQAHAVARGSGPRVERAHDIDVGHPQRIPQQRQPFRRMERHAVVTALDELE